MTLTSWYDFALLSKDDFAWPYWTVRHDGDVSGGHQNPFSLKIPCWERSEDAHDSLVRHLVREMHAREMHERDGGYISQSMPCDHCMLVCEECAHLQRA